MDTFTPEELDAMTSAYENEVYLYRRVPESMHLGERIDTSGMGGGAGGLDWEIGYFRGIRVTACFGRLRTQVIVYSDGADHVYKIRERSRWYPFANFPASCAHEWAQYEGLTERYEYCTKCDNKKE